VALAALVVLALGTAGLRGTGPDTLATASSPVSVPAGSPDPAAGTPEAAASPSPSPAPTDAAPCPDAALDVRATTDARSYPAGVKPVLTLTVRNTGATPCRRPLGQGATELLITSGADRVWSSDDCTSGGPLGEVVLQPAAESTSKVVWSATRSVPGCPSGQRAALPGTYHLSARIGELRRDGDTFVLQG